MDRRNFLKNMGVAGSSVLLASSPWFSAFSETEHTKNSTVQLAVIGPGSRGGF